MVYYGLRKKVTLKELRDIMSIDSIRIIPVILPLENLLGIN